MVLRNLLARWRRLPSKGRVTPQDIVTELIQTTQQIYGVVKKAQDAHAEENQAKAMKGHIPGPLPVGQLVLLRIPLAAVRHDVEKTSIKSKT